ncbi:Glycerol-3-phosphate dehydrogenase (NAD(P)+) [Gloeomargarita lithophora Alchichica-D10]|uniref:Glycerol-3-phosphate dehydrogenase [NAD(P)+] n=1 Tax=Gloeomargarita lithophora Alchichica-D10 TaxID=1188229 RepID=A0A1J0AET1_9CYAN|nr:NAD(P)H-dependent glycerol-3-phosphate dehydrogenase [Gloeomargarita lithophora]APB34424.1 Glycerol-3-phosphate dehydrogenase (NAD(P)+) [Gloeomargarita lithophora Alchichica-D10]
MNPEVVAVLGGGVWGSLLAALIRDNGYPVRVWSRRQGGNLEEIVQPATMLVVAVSVAGVLPVIQRLTALPSGMIIVSTTKGLLPGNYRTPAQAWQRAFPGHGVVALSGPNLAAEIAQGLPAATVAASVETSAAQRVQQVLASERLRVYTNNDPLGTELGGALKNVMAIAAGVCDGLNLGANAKASLITRALAEMVRVAVDLGANTYTLYGLSGLGDLLATCNSPLSRNYRLGYGLAQGKSLAVMLQELQTTVEGVNTTQVLVQMADQRGLRVPIAQQVDALLQGHINPQQAVVELMGRDLKAEFHPEPL